MSQWSSISAGSFMWMCVFVVRALHWQKYRKFEEKYRKFSPIFSKWEYFCQNGSIKVVCIFLQIVLWFLSVGLDFAYNQLNARIAYCDTCCVLFYITVSVKLGEKKHFQKHIVPTENFLKTRNFPTMFPSTASSFFATMCLICWPPFLEW